MNPNKLQEIPIPTPTPIPTFVIPDDQKINADWVGTIGESWAMESVQIWRVIPLDYRSGIQIAIFFAIFITAFAMFIRRLRARDDKGAD